MEKQKKLISRFSFVVVGLFLLGFVIGYKIIHIQFVEGDSFKLLAEKTTIQNFEIIFLQGGATFQNTFIPANKPSLLDNISFLISGTWGKKTHEDFQKYYGKKIEKFDIPNGNLPVLLYIFNLRL